jgi:hypothetical protein
MLPIRQHLHGLVKDSLPLTWVYKVLSIEGVNPLNPRFRKISRSMDCLDMLIDVLCYPISNNPSQMSVVLESFTKTKQGLPKPSRGCQ